jgi:quinol monooxygenase YgiN
MVCAFIFESSDIDQVGYDGLMKGIGREAIDAPGPAGYIAHISGPRQEGGWRAVDLWESESAANAFYTSPLFQSVVGKETSIVAAPWALHRVELERTMRELS